MVAFIILRGFAPELHPQSFPRPREFATLHDTAMRRCVETLLDVRMDDQTWNVFGSCHQINQLTTLKGIASRMLGSTPEVGKRWLMESATLDDAGPGMRQHGWQFKAMLNVVDFFMSSSIWPGLLDASRLCSDLKVVRFQAFRSLVVLQLFTAGSMPRFGVLLLRRLWLPLPPSSRRPSTSLATTEWHARMWECWVAVDLPWKVQLPASAKKPAAASPSMLQYATLTLVSLTEQTTAGWRSLQTGCRCSMGPRLQSARLSFLSCAGMERLILDV